MYFLAEQIMISFRIRKREKKFRREENHGRKILHPEEENRKPVGWKEKFMLRI